MKTRYLICCVVSVLTISKLLIGPGYTIAPYDKNWPVLFSKEHEALERVLGPLAQKIEHIGSTSVPGLSAKPIIDIIITINNKMDARQVVERLQKYGYVFKGAHKVQKDTPWYWGLWLSFHKNSNKGTRLYQIHLVENNSPIYHDYIALRDYMRRHPDDAQKYAELKKSLKKIKKQRYEYRQGKGPFLDSILPKAQKEYYAPIFAEYRITEYNDQWPLP